VRQRRPSPLTAPTSLTINVGDQPITFSGTVPPAELSFVGLFGHDGPDPKWTWSRQLLGGVVLVVTVGLVLIGF
jgi:hypothetical protein